MAGDEEEGQVVFNKIKSEPVSRPHCEMWHWVGWWLGMPQEWGHATITLW